jgi:hypothetical protein
VIQPSTRFAAFATIPSITVSCSWFDEPGGFVEIERRLLDRLDARA